VVHNEDNTDWVPLSTTSNSVPQKSRNNALVVGSQNRFVRYKTARSQAAVEALVTTLALALEKRLSRI